MPELTDAPAAAVHILVVDDDRDILQMLSVCLKQHRYSVSTALSSDEAYRLMDDISFDAIITDVQMPGEDGIAFLGRIRQRLPDVPVIIMTGYAQFQVAVNAIKNGAFDFIHKPFDFSYIIKVIEKAVNFTALIRMQKNYLADLESTVASRTEDLKNAMIQLEETHKALMSAANEKNEFMAKISHEMRTPMNGVIGGLDLLEDTELNGEQTEYLHIVRTSAENMMLLVDDLISFGGAAGRFGTVCLEQVDLAAVVDSVAADHRMRFAEKGLAFDVRIPQGFPRRVRCDGEQFARLLDILICNAFKFTDKGGATLDVSAERPENNMALIRVTVSDSGIGIPADMQERIFDPFIQVDGSSTRRFGGAGLGLSIARQIAQVLNGTLNVVSTPGEGSSFIFTMNIAVNGDKETVK